MAEQRRFHPRTLSATRVRPNANVLLYSASNYHEPQLYVFWIRYHSIQDFEAEMRVVSTAIAVRLPIVSDIIALLLTSIDYIKTPNVV